MEFKFTIILWIYSIIQSIQSNPTHPFNMITVNYTDLPVICNTDFMRTYKLKGVFTTNKTEELLICPNIDNNCCSRHDQMYIFHYLTDVLPERILTMSARRNLIMSKYNKMHNRIMNTYLEFDGKLPKDEFCRKAATTFKEFDFKDLYKTFLKLHKDWDDKKLEYSEKFYCFLCDGSNHQYFSHRRTITLSKEFCHSTLKLNAEKIEFWSKSVMDYLKILQSVVDCNHYEYSFNLTFWNPQKLEHFQDVFQCIQNVDDDFELYCSKTCNHLNLASITPYMDGDFVFLEKTYNIFEKFNFNRETGSFTSIKMRHFFKKFEILKPLNLTHSRGAFTRLIRTVIRPVDQPVNPVQFVQSELRLPRKLHLYEYETGLNAPKKPERKLTMNEIINRQLQNQPKTEFELMHTKPSNPRSIFIGNTKSINSDRTILQKLNNFEQFYKNGRRLASTTQTSKDKAQSNDTGAFMMKKKFRTPDVWMDPKDYLYYDQIPIRKQEIDSEFVYEIFVHPIEIDQIPKNIGPEGVDMSIYQVMNTHMIDEVHFHNKVYKVQREDTFDVSINEMISKVDEFFMHQAKRTLKRSFTIHARNLILSSPRISNLAANRKLLQIDKKKFKKSKSS